MAVERRLFLAAFSLVTAVRESVKCSEMWLRLILTYSHNVSKLKVYI